MFTCIFSINNWQRWHHIEDFNFSGFLALEPKQFHSPFRADLLFPWRVPAASWTHTAPSVTTLRTFNLFSELIPDSVPKTPAGEVKTLKTPPCRGGKTGVGCGPATPEHRGETGARLQEGKCVSVRTRALLPSSTHTGSEVISLHCAVEGVLRGRQRSTCWPTSMQIRDTCIKALNLQFSCKVSVLYSEEQKVGEFSHLIIQ